MSEAFRHPRSFRLLALALILLPGAGGRASLDTSKDAKDDYVPRLGEFAPPGTR